MAIKVLLLTQWFDPEPTFKGLAFARELVRQGFDVEVVTGFPNYPGGKVYLNYQIKWLQREIIDGVHVTRVPLYPSHDQSAIKRILNYVSFATSALIYSLFIARRPDVIYAYHPPLTVGIAAVILRFFRKIPVVYDIQDMWPDTLRATGMITSKRILCIVNKVCNWVYRHVDHIAVLSPGFKHLLIARAVPSEKISVIYNWSDETALQNSSGPTPAAFPDNNKFRILFAGNMGKAQALGSVLKAAQLTMTNAPDICFIFVGGGLEVAALKQQATNLALTNVLFLPPVPMSEIGSLLREADVLLVHLCKDPLFEITIPSKTQAYMAVGKPILMCVGGDAADLIKKAQNGITVDSEDAHHIAIAAQQLSHLSSEDLKKMALNSINFYEKNLSLETGVSAFNQIFTTLARKAEEN